MATNKVKNLKKTDWQTIAKTYGIDFTDKNEVRYLVEKIAEKVGVDDKIVKLDDLKKAVGEQIFAETSELKSSEIIVDKEALEMNPSLKEEGIVEGDKITIEKEAIVETENLDEAELIHYRQEANRLGVNYGALQLANDIKQILDFHCMKNPPVTYVPFGSTLITNTDAPTVSRLDELRKECLEYGVAYAPAHTENDLEQLLGSIRGIVAKNPITDMPTDSFELKADNIDKMVASAPSVSVPNPIIQPQGNIMQVITASQPMMATIGSKEMNGYRDMFVHAIRGHFRLLTERDIRDLIDKEKYPFSYTLKQNPHQNNKIEMFFTNGNNTVRVPSEDSNDWIEING